MSPRLPLTAPEEFSLLEMRRAIYDIRGGYVLAATGLLCWFPIFIVGWLVLAIGFWQLRGIGRAYLPASTVFMVSVVAAPFYIIAALTGSFLAAVAVPVFVTHTFIIQIFLNWCVLTLLMRAAALTRSSQSASMAAIRTLLTVISGIAVVLVGSLLYFRVSSISPTYLLAGLWCVVFASSLYVWHQLFVVWEGLTR